MKAALRVGLVVLCVLGLVSASAWSAPEDDAPRRGPAVRPAPPLRPGPKKPRTLRMTADLRVSLLGFGAATTTPWRSGEIQVPYGSQATIHWPTPKATPVFRGLRFTSPVTRAASVEWQAVVAPRPPEQEDWAHPTGLVAKGTAKTIDGGTADGAVYFVLDLAPVLHLPPEYRLRRPFSVRRRLVPRPGPVRRPPRVVPRPPGRQPLAPVARKSLMRKPSARTAAFRKLATAFRQHKVVHLRVVLLDAKRSAVALSNFVTVRTGVPSAVTLHPGMTGGTPSGPTLKAPEVKVLAYHPPIYRDFTESARWRIVLANCPEYMRRMMNWEVGKAYYFKPKGDSSWYEKAGDAISSAIDALGGVANWISEAWEDVQARCVDTVCAGNATCKQVAGPALKIGLAYCGIPPDLPNTSDLAGMGKDYIVTYVASETGVDEAVIRKGVDALTDIVHNPPGGAGGAFLWPSPAHQDQPARIDVEVHNPGPDATDGMLLWLKYGSTVGDTATHPPLIPTYLDTKTPLPPVQPGKTLRFSILLTRNPETMISHGADRMADYQGRRVQIYFSNGTPALFLPTNWAGQAGN